MNAWKRRWRRRWIVDDLQYRMLFTNVAYFVVGALIVGATVFIPLIVEVRDTTIPAAQRSLAAGELLSLHRRFWPGLILAVILLGMHSVLTSHRVSGPLYRFRQVLRGAAKGDVSQQIRLRRHDFLLDEADTINELLEALRVRYGRIDAHREELGRLADELERATQNADPTFRENVLRLRRELDGIAEQLDGLVLEAAPRQARETTG